MELVPFAVLPLCVAAWWLLSASFTWLLLGLLWVLAYYVWTSLQHQPDPSCDLPLPPGSLGFPVVGESLQFIYSLLTQGDFHGHRTKKYGKVFKTNILGNPTIRVTGIEDVSKILNNKNNEFILRYPSAVRTLIGENSGATMTNGDLHKQYRRLYLKAFTSQALKQHMHKMSEVIQLLIQEWIKLGDLLVFHQAHHLAFSVTYYCLLGLPHNPSHLTKIEQGFNQFLNGLFSPPFNIPGTRFSKAMRAKHDMQKNLEPFYLGNLDNIDRNSAMFHLIQTIKQQQMSTTSQDILDVAIEMAFAGHVTTASSVTSITMVLGKYPDVLKKLREELSAHGMMTSDDDLHLDYDILVTLPYLHNVVKEVLFHYPPAGGGFRKAVKTVGLKNYQIPKDWYVIYSIQGTHADILGATPTFSPERWEKMDKSTSDKFNFLTFSAGSRPCAGKDFAILVLKCFTVHLVRQCEWELQHPEVEMVPLPSRHPADNLPIRIRPI